MSERGMQEDACKKSEPRKRSSLYVFPNATPCLTGHHHLEPAAEKDAKIAEAGEQGVGALDHPRSISETPILRIMSASKTHARSASHGGVLATSSCSAAGSAGSATARISANSNWMGEAPVAPIARPSALKKPGHQRAFSHGQVVEVQQTSGHLGTIAGHSRVGSKTDFILPPGHRDDAETRPTAVPKAPSFRGHSRQASRSESIYTIRRSVAPPLWRRIWSQYFGNLLEEPHLRTIVPNHLFPPNALQNQHANGKVIDNRVRTTKYSTLTFLPRNLLEQFHRVANLYFIFIVLLNWVPAINAFGKEVAMIPVLFVLGVTALKDFFEDRRRLASDRRVNNSTCRVYISEDNRYKKMAWKDVKVGDIVHLSNNELIPADMLLLRSSDPQGFSYLDTCNLDGETNLKQRQVVGGFLNLQTCFQPSKFRSIIEIDKPSTKIYRFHGAVVHPNGGRVPVSTENLLLRESVLKNTDFVEGIVVYVGHETKAMLNNGGPRYKRSRLERQMNLDVIWCVVILIVLCVVGAAGCRFWLSTYALVGPVPFLPIMQDPSYEGMLTFWTFIIILQVMIPLSLYVTIEMAKLGQVYHIINDRELYDAETDRTAECRALNITEELGQIQYVFSDKTGTLTENKMLFRRCAVGGQDYAHTGDGENILPCKRLKEDLLIGNCRHRLQEFLILLAICNTVVVNTHPHRDSMNSSGVIEETTNHGEPDTVRPKLLILPTISSSLATLTKRLSPLGQRMTSSNSSSVSATGAEQRAAASATTPEASNAIYESESPDELALVHAAKAYDVRLTGRTNECATVSLPDKSCLAFQILKILPFDSNRRCMSIVVRHPYTNEIVLYSKGADSTIMQALTSSEEESSVTAKARQQLLSYSRQGLRTLVMARRSLSPDVYERWRERHAEIEASVVVGGGGNCRERRVRESYASLESQMSLLGATGIEDKLQPGVPEAVASLLSAGIVVWVLTGDKPETAVNIAYSSGLFSPSMQLLRLQARSKSMAESLIHAHLETAAAAAAAANSAGQSQQGGGTQGDERVAYRIGGGGGVGGGGGGWGKRQRALVIDGKTLTFILDPRSNLTAPFLELTTSCASVLACRTTPLQKAYIVKVVKEQLRMRTLAIGDGANDVSMIQTADVGIGVSGREGTQAVMAADFSIPRFPMLTRLLFMHGHWCYDRLSRMILYFFYKNATFVFVIFWYQLYCGFSGAVMIDQIYLMLYNLIFTSLPPLVLGVYDQIAPASLLLESPRLYERGRLASVYQPHSFWIIMADALYQSIVIFFLIEAAYHDSDVDIWEFGSTITTCCIIVMLLHISIETRSWTLIHAAGILASFGAFFGFSLFYNAVCVNCLGLPGSYWVMEKALGQHVYWLSVILASVLAILPRVAYRTVKCTIAPDIIQRARVAQRAKTNESLVGGTEDSELVAEWSRSSEHATIRSANYSGKKNVLTTIVA